MAMDVALKKVLIEDCAKVIAAHADELTSLDQAIGDGDHGVNMKRGFESLLADADALAHVVEARGVEALLREQLGGCGQDLRAGAGCTRRCEGTGAAYHWVGFLPVVRQVQSQRHGIA